jgi:hypothetical protein
MSIPMCLEHMDSGQNKQVGDPTVPSAVIPMNFKTFGVRGVTEMQCHRNAVELIDTQELTNTAKHKLTQTDTGVSISWTGAKTY